MEKKIPIALSRAFSLVELLIVIAIIGILAGIAIPQMNVSETARSTVAQQNLDNINVAVESYRQLTGRSLFEGIPAPSAAQMQTQIESLKTTRPNIGPLSGAGLERRPLLSSGFAFSYGGENDRPALHRGVWNGYRLVLVRPSEAGTTGAGCIYLE